MRLRCAGLVLLAMLLAAGCGGGDDDGAATHSYVGSTDDLVLYVTWNRDGDKLKGALTQGVINRSAGEVETTRSSLEGTINGSGVAIDVQQTSGGTSTLTGTLNGDALSLEYLRPSEGVVAVQLGEGGAGVFNAALTTLRDRVEQAKADEDSQAAQTSERDLVAQHAQTVQDDIDALEAAVDVARSAKGAGNDGGLSGLRRDLQTLRDHEAAVRRADSLAVCSSAATVQTDLYTLERRITALRSKQDNRDQGVGSVDEAIDKLREDFLALQSDDPQYLPPDAPTQRTVGRAIQQARRKLRKAGTSPKDTMKATDAILKEARELNGRASARCQTPGA